MKDDANKAATSRSKIGEELKDVGRLTSRPVRSILDIFLFQLYVFTEHSEGYLGDVPFMLSTK